MVLFVRKNGEINCSETWENAYRLIFQTKATIEYIDLDAGYSSTRVDAKADAENFAITIFVPAECGCDTKLIEITYSQSDGISERETSTQLSEEMVKKLGFDPTKQGLPIWYMWGDTTGEDKDHEVTLTYQFGEHSGTLKRKWQGSGSVDLGKDLGAIIGDELNGKFNYTIKLDNAIEAKEGWGLQKKYCLKANVADFSHARNLIATRLWGQARANSASPSPMLYKCPNWGAVDGFPVLLVVNDEYRGLYTMNIPKDGWMLNMPHEGATREAIVCAEVGANFNGTVTIGNAKKYEIEYVTDENDAGWVQESLQALWDAVKNSNGGEVKARLDIESAIDYLLMVAKCSGGDALARNYILHTTDGIKWAFTVYDADTWFGINWGGVGHLADDGLPTVYDCAEANALMMYLVKFFPDDVVARYNALRETVLSAKNIAEMVLDFEAQIPKAVFDAEVVRWPGISTTATNNAAQIIDHIRAREPIIDEEVARLNAPTLPAKAGWYNVDASGAAMNTITDINFDPDYEVTGKEEASWDCSLNKDNGIMAYRTGTVVTIKPTNHKYVKLPVDSTYMFANDGTNASFAALARITGTEIFTCQPKASMAYMFINCNKLKTPVYIPHGVINCNSMYVNTWSLKSPSVIPNGVLYMSGMYNGGSLNTLPQIPDSVTEMNDAFVGNVYATNLPRVIPAGVIVMHNAFKTCRAVQGMIEVKAKNITNYTNAFLDACTNSDGIVLVGPNTQLAEIAATNADGKVTVAN